MDKSIFAKEELLTTSEVANRTNFSRRFWENRRITGDTPIYIQVSKRAVRYRWSDVQSWLDNKLKNNTSSKGVHNAR